MHTVQTYKSNNRTKKEVGGYLHSLQSTPHTHGPTDYLVHYSIQFFSVLPHTHRHTSTKAESDDWQVFDEKRLHTVKQSLSILAQTAQHDFWAICVTQATKKGRPLDYTPLVKLFDLFNAKRTKNVISILWARKKKCLRRCLRLINRNIKIDDYVRIYASITFAFHFYVPKPSRWLTVVPSTI